jgi:hypothetical protein
MACLIVVNRIAIAGILVGLLDLKCSLTANSADKIPSPLGELDSIVFSVINDVKELEVKMRNHLRRMSLTSIA